MIELYILVSSICITSGKYGGLYPVSVNEENYWGEKVCVQTAMFSTSSKTVEGQTAYRVMQTNPVRNEEHLCDIVGHWWIKMLPETKDDIRIREICEYCNRRRQKVTETKWVEEP